MYWTSETIKKIYDVEDIDIILNKISKSIVKDNKKIEYYNIPCSFDIEVSSFYDKVEKVAIMYEWTLCLDGLVMIGRNWKEFIKVTDKISNYLDLNEDKRLVIYVHNLGYEFQFLCKRFNWIDVFSLEKRKPLKALTTTGIEFRCSMLLSGYSLAKLSEQLLKYKVEKMVGDLDYSKLRTEKTKLSKKELNYCKNDCLVVVAYIQELIEKLGNITKIPLTKTGFVRNYCRSECLYNDKSHKDTYKFKKYNLLMKSLRLDEDIFNQLQRAFGGGFTHANAMWSGEIMNNVSSFDFTSSYPYVMVSEKFPMSSAEHINLKTKEEFDYNLKTYCCLFDCTFTNIKSKVLYENYISKSHCTKLNNAIENNGRIVSADILCITITEQDYMIIKKLYSWENLSISNFNRFKKEYLPTDFVKSILKLYKDKTELKDVVGKEREYLNSKEQVNSAYGMCVTNPCRDEIFYTTEWSSKKTDIKEALYKYNKSTKRFLYYPWGVWVTAYARVNLFSGIIAFKEDYIYSDTDSIKVLNANNHMQYIDAYNNLVKIKLQNAMQYHNIPINWTKPKNIYGEEKQLGIWEYECTYNRFKTIGAKRYIIEKEPSKKELALYPDRILNDKLISITVSGVNKGVAIPYLIKKYKDKIFEKFNDELNIPAKYSGKNVHTYIDETREGWCVDYQGQEYHYKELSGVHLEETSYSMSISEQYAEYLMNIKIQTIY